MTYLKITTAISVLIFIASLFFPGFDCGGRKSSLGIEILFSGAFGIFVLDPRWYANLIYFYIAFNVIFKNSPNMSNINVFSMAILAISSYIIPPWAACPSGGTLNSAKGLGLGGYIWAASLLTLAFGTYLYNFYNQVRSGEKSI